MNTQDLTVLCSYTLYPHFPLSVNRTHNDTDLICHVTSKCTVNAHYILF